MVNINELAFLQKYSDKKLEAKSSYFDIRYNILDTTLARTKNYTESTHSCYTKTNSPFEMIYSYQRYDLNVKNVNWLGFLYDYPNIKNKTDALLVTSGMAAINLVITALNSMKFDNRIIATKNYYFETKDLVGGFFDYFNIEEIEKKEYENNGILYIDSSSNIIGDIDYRNDHRVVIIDTSCFDLGSDIIGNLIAKFKKNSFIILIRSHIKLDCFGLELSRLGSVLFIYPENNEDNFKLGEKIFKSCDNLVKVNGGNFEIKNIYPWFGSKEFFDLTKARTNRIMDFCREMENCLSKKIDSHKYEIITHEHRQYFYIKFLFKYEKKYKDYYDYGDYLVQKAQRLDLPVRNSCSFGLDLVTFDEFATDFGTKSTHLRVTASDLDIKDARLICDFLSDELKDLEEEK